MSQIRLSPKPPKPKQKPPQMSKSFCSCITKDLKATLILWLLVANNSDQKQLDNDVQKHICICLLTTVISFFKRQIRTWMDTNRARDTWNKFFVDAIKLRKSSPNTWKNRKVALDKWSCKFVVMVNIGTVRCCKSDYINCNCWSEA